MGVVAPAKGTRIWDVGMTCPSLPTSWPMGFWIPTLSRKAYSHRFIKIIDEKCDWVPFLQHDY